MLKNVLIILILALPFTSQAVGNGIYECAFEDDGVVEEYSFELTDSSIRFIGEEEDSISWSPDALDQWFDDPNTEDDGWVTRFKVVRDETVLVIVADNVSTDDDLREIVYSILAPALDSENEYTFTFIDHLISEDGATVETSEADVSFCVKL